MRVLLIGLLAASLTQAETLTDFSAICLGETHETVGVDRPLWGGGCEVRSGEKLLEISINLVGPVRESYIGPAQVDVLYRDPVGVAPPMLFVSIHGWLTATMIPHDPGVVRELVRAVARDGSQLRDRKSVV